MNQTSPLVIEIPRIHVIEFRTRKYAQGFDETMRAVFPKASWYPREQRWTLRVTDEEYAGTRDLLDTIFENFYYGEYPELAIMLDVARQAEIAPLTPKTTPLSNDGWWLRYVKPVGATYDGIDV